MKVELTAAAHADLDDVLAYTQTNFPFHWRLWNVDFALCSRASATAHMRHAASNRILMCE